MVQCTSFFTIPDLMKKFNMSPRQVIDFLVFLGIGLDSYAQIDEFDLLTHLNKKIEPEVSFVPNLISYKKVLELFNNNSSTRYQLNKNCRYITMYSTYLYFEEDVEKILKRKECYEPRLRKTTKAS
jgi:hypothetical protein